MLCGTKTMGFASLSPSYGTLLYPRLRQSRLVALARVFLPILAEAVFRDFLGRMRAQSFDIGVDAETGRGRQVDPAVFDRQPRYSDVAADLLEIDEILGDPEVRDHRRDMHGRRHTY